MSAAESPAVLADLRARVEQKRESIRFIESDDRAATNGGYDRIRQMESDIAELERQIAALGGGT